jgi:hypothetical protein
LPSLPAFEDRRPWALSMDSRNGQADCHSYVSGLSPD